MYGQMLAQSKLPRSLCRIALISLQAGCSAEVGVLEPARDPAPSTAPAVTVEFPAAISLTEATSITIRGRASDADGVKSVRINGAIAGTADDFASWELTVSLSPGENSFVIEAEDGAGIVDDHAALVAVRSEPLLFLSPHAVVVDEATRSVLVFDQGRAQLASIELGTGRRTLISGESRGRGPA